MSLKDNINKGFTIGNIATVNYDDEAKIKVKEYYELDKLERGKLLELAGQVDIELAKRDMKLGELEEKINNSGSGGGSTGDGLNTYYPPKEKGYYYILYKKVITKAEIDEKFKLSLDKYNNLSTNDKYSIDYSLKELGLELPITLEKVKAFINGKPTGRAGKNLMYICSIFSDCVELETDIYLEFFRTDLKSTYLSERKDYYKLFLPKLTIYINENKELIFSEQEILGTWKRTEGNKAPMYNSSACPVMMQYNFTETGDCELIMVLNANYTSNYVFKTNVEIQKEEIKSYPVKYLIPLTEFDYNTIFYNSILTEPANINHYISKLDKSKMRIISVSNTVGTQINTVKIQLMANEEIVIEGDQYTDKKVELLKNLNLTNINGSKEITLSGSSTENIKAILNYASLTVTVPKGENLVIKASVSYTYEESFINSLY